MGRQSKVGVMIVPVSFWEVFAFGLNFSVLKAEKFSLFSLQKCAQPLYLSAFRFYLPALLDESHTLLMHNPK
ncbi:MAG: hypothetical protein F6K40_01165 [Okeania sp. SIO3I5]|uniref:hypothetical protein n=1 Tax=Okeania sp. SIO3I5 TaxID=2607805 RepID=UPI0013BB63A4|nr:hypothetical protein [Okeania sp. SIO3I5]NEQ34993.1 hypothetical protein [Okeania sp. SIO3I5]